jgi:hypothetical protein
MTTFTISSYCSHGDCIEVGITPDGVVVRDTRDRARGLVFDHEDWRAFVLGVKGGEFDLDQGLSVVVEP